MKQDEEDNMNRQITKTIKISNEYEVIVVGGGPSGCAAAMAAARSGAKTLLIEKTGMLGGAATAGLVNSWAPFSDGKQIIYSGIAKKIFNKMKEKMPQIPQSSTRWVPIDSEILKRVYDSAMEEYGVTVLFDSTLCGVEMKDKSNVKFLLIANKLGITGYHGKVYIDCSGDGDLACWAGANYFKGNGLGKMQNASHCFILSNVNEAGYYKDNHYVLHPDNANSAIHRIITDDRFAINDLHCCSDFFGPKLMGFNAGHLENIDGTDPFSISKGLMMGRKLAEEYRKAFAEYEPQAFARSVLVETAPSLGIRETRIIEGDYTFTVEDYLKRASFKDEICRNCYYLDVHGTSISEGTQRYKVGESHGIPFRCLIPSKLDNVLVAGRIISSDRIANGSLRVMPTCLSTGEAAGVAAGQSVKRQRIANVHCLNVNEIRDAMKYYGAYLP